MEVQFENQQDRVKVSCPHCEKPYHIFLSDLHEESSRFVCKKCQMDFWVKRSEIEAPIQEEPGQKKPLPVVGLSTDFVVGTPIEKCPKCGHSVESLDKECGSCGVVGAKFLALKEETPYLKVSEPLKKLWKRVLNHYDDDQIHHEFISQCLKENQLRYASLQYKHLKNTLGADPTVNQMLSKVQSLAEFQVVKSEKKKEATASQFPEVKRWIRWEVLLFVIGILFIASGLASPLAKNLVSVGVVFMALPILIRIFFLKR